MVFYVKEICRTQVIVTVILACIDAVDVDFRPNVGGREIVCVQVDVRAERFKFAAYFADHHVTNAETNRSVCCVELPSHTVYLRVESEKS